MEALKTSLDLAFDEQAFEQTNFLLRGYCADKAYRLGIPLNEVERTYFHMARIGGAIVADGFVAVFHELFSPETFAAACDNHTEVGGIRFRDLLREAWHIYTKGKNPITWEEFRVIPVMRFNTNELMERFDAIGEEVMADIQQQHATGKVWPVEYAKRHWDEFEPIDQARKVQGGQEPIVDR